MKVIPGGKAMTAQRLAEHPGTARSERPSTLGARLPRGGSPYRIVVNCLQTTQDGRRRASVKWRQWRFSVGSPFGQPRRALIGGEFRRKGLPHKPRHATK